MLSSITGNEVDINVTGHTELIGALIAARDEDGNDTGKLTFSTDSLNIEHLSNRSYSSSQSAGVSANVAVSSQANAGNPTQSNTDLALNSSNYSYQNNSSQSLDKTLATIGQGSISVGGEAVNPEGLNRDIANLTKDIYDVDRQQGNIELTVDHRLLTEEGRNQIKEDITKIADKVDSVIDNLNKASEELAGNVSDAADKLQQGASESVEDKDTTGQQLAEKAEGISQQEADSLLAQELVLPELALGEAEAPPMPDKTFEQQQGEFGALRGLLNDYYADNQQHADQSLEAGINRGVYAASKNETLPGFGSDIDFDGAIGFYQSQREAAYSGLGLGAGASEGGLADFIGWAAASVTNESWQGVQFLGKAATLGLISNPFDGSSYHSLIGDNTLFGSPQTFAGAVGVEQGVITSYFAGVEGILAVGVAGGKSFGKAASKAELPPTLLNDLERGGSYLITETDFKKYAEPALNNNYPVGRPDGQFMTTAKEMNQAILDTGGNSAELGKLFGVDTWSGQNLIRIDVDNPTNLNPRLPTQSNSGANTNFIPGGKTSGGISEVVTDVIPPEKVWVTPLKPIFGDGK